MIISHKYKFIFIKLKKTASTSIEVALEKMCSENYIITPIKPVVEGHNPRNFGEFYNHIGAAKIKSMVPTDVWNNYFKFCFERNPWDKMVSLFWFEKERRKLRNESFREYVIHFDEDHPGGAGINSFVNYSIGGKVVVDFIGRYENLLSDFQKVCDKLDLPFDGVLTREKSDTRQNKRHYSTYYDSEIRELVSQRFSREISLLDYSFEDKFENNF